MYPSYEYLILGGLIGGAIMPKSQRYTTKQLLSILGVGILLALFAVQIFFKIIA